MIIEKPIIVEQFADNGEFSHWHLIDPKTGNVMWSSFPEETLARGQKIISYNEIIDMHIEQEVNIKKQNNDNDITCMTFFS